MAKAGTRRGPPRASTKATAKSEKATAKAQQAILLLDMGLRQCQGTAPLTHTVMYHMARGHPEVTMGRHADARHRAVAMACVGGAESRLYSGACAHLYPW